MDLITTLGRTLGFSFAAGINLYATVAMLGLAARLCGCWRKDRLLTQEIGEFVSW